MHLHGAGRVTLNTKRPRVIERQHELVIGRVWLVTAHARERPSRPWILVVCTKRMHMILRFLMTSHAYLINLHIAKVGDVTRVQVVTRRTPLVDRAVQGASVELVAIMALQARVHLRLTAQKTLMPHVRRMAIDTHTDRL